MGTTPPLASRDITPILPITTSSTVMSSTLSSSTLEAETMASDTIGIPAVISTPLSTLALSSPSFRIGNIGCFDDLGILLDMGLRIPVTIWVVGNHLPLPTNRVAAGNPLALFSLAVVALGVMGMETIKMLE